jgi:hypothetical protein
LMVMLLERGESEKKRRWWERHTRSFVRLKKINARLKKSEGARVRARQKRERERERENNHTHHHGRILRRGGPPSAVHVFLYGKFLSKTLIFWRRKQVTPQASNRRPKGLKKKKRKKTTFIYPSSASEQKQRVDRFVQISHSFIHPFRSETECDIYLGRNLDRGK